MEQPKRIMIVEDNATIREGFEAIINGYDKYELAGSYDTCEAAIKNMAPMPPDVVLMDIDLPGISGIEGTARIKRSYPGTIVLIITVLEDSNKVFQSLCAGAGGYIVKNSGTANLIKSIDEALAGGAPMSLHIASMVVRSFNLAVDSPLTDRETQVLQGIAQGKSYTKIANELFINKETVRSHIRNIYQKLAVNSKSDALRVASNNHWIK